MGTQGGPRPISILNKRAFKFDAISESLSNIFDFQGLNSAASFTISIWVKKLTSGTSEIVSIVDENSQSDSVIINFDASNKIEASIRGASNNCKTNVINLNEWTNIALIYNGAQIAANRMRIYVNGSVNQSINNGVSFSSLSSSLNRVLIGGNGIIVSEIAIWRDVFNASKVSYLSLLIPGSKINLGNSNMVPRPRYWFNSSASKWNNYGERWALMDSAEKLLSQTSEMEELDRVTDSPSYVDLLYSSNSYSTNYSNPTPIISGLTGGTFSSPLSGLSVNSSTGELKLDVSSAGLYTVRYEVPQVTSVEKSINLIEAKSIELDGIDDYVDCGNDSSLSFGNGTSDSPFSISAWIKPVDSAKFRIAFKFGTTREYFFQVANGKKLQASLYDNSASSSIGRNGNTTIPQNVWSHVVMTYNGSGFNNGVKVYLNSNLDNGSTFGSGTYTSMEETSQHFEIGRFVGATNAKGKIDELSVYNSALSQSDIDNLYGTGSPNDISDTNPISWWKCGDGDTPLTLKDSGSASNDGIMNNFSTFSTDVPTSPSYFSNKSMYLDGVDERVDTPEIDLGLENTISFWAKRSGANFDGMVWGGTSQSNYYTVFLNPSQRIQYRVGSGANTFDTANINSKLSTDTWFHCALVRNNSGADVLCYINGALEQTINGIVGSGDNTIVKNIGSRGPTPLDFQIRGYLDELSLFNSALSPAEISTIYGTGVPSDISSLSPLSWYRCGELDNTTTLRDSGSGKNHGTLINFSTFNRSVPT